MPPSPFPFSHDAVVAVVVFARCADFCLFTKNSSFPSVPFAYLRTLACDSNESSYIFVPARLSLDTAAGGTGWRGLALHSPLPPYPRYLHHFKAHSWANGCTYDFGPSRPFDQRGLNYNILHAQKNLTELTFPIFPCGVL